MPQALQIAPTPQLLHHLTIFQRTFLSVEAYTQRGDKAGMLLGGWLADALHNVPHMLLHYDDDGVHNPVDTSAWLKSFPASMRGRGAPTNIVADCQHVLSNDGAATELGLKDDMSDFGLAPEAKLREYLDMIHRAFLSMRVMTSHGNRPLISWHELDQVWTEAAFSHAALNGLMASVLSPLPLGLVRWSRFKEDEFRQNAMNVGERLCVESRNDWRNFFQS